MYSKNSLLNDEIDEYIQTNSETMQWNKLNHIEVENAIKFVNSLEACDLDEINWQIIQKAYATISKIFNLLYSKLLDFEHHSICWCFSLEAIIRKSNKSDYTVSKAYRIIALLNCLEKIAEKSWQIVYCIEIKRHIYCMTIKSMIEKIDRQLTRSCN